MSNFYPSALLLLFFYPPAPHPNLTVAKELSPLHSLLPAFIPRSLSLSPPTSLISPHRPPPAFLQHLLLAHAFHLSYPGHVTPPHIPFYPSLLHLGAGCWGSGWGSLPDKLRFRRAETGGEGNLSQTFVSRIVGKKNEKIGLNTDSCRVLKQLNMRDLNCVLWRNLFSLLMCKKNQNVLSDKKNNKFKSNLKMFHRFLLQLVADYPSIYELCYFWGLSL